MNRWSIVKRFGKIDYTDFVTFANRFCEAINACYASPSLVTITFFNKVPHYITSWQPELEDYLAEENRKKQIGEVVGLENATRDLFDRAIYVSLRVVPTEESNTPQYTFGSLECKGLRKRHMVFYVQPKEIGDYVQKRTTRTERPSRIAFTIGDDYEHCCSVSYS